MSVPLLDALDRSGWEPTLLTAPLAAKAIGRPGFVPFEKARSFPAVLRHARVLRAGGYQACLLVNRSFRAALVAKLAKIPVRVGHSMEGRRSLLTHVIPYDPDRFEAATIADLAGPLGVVVDELRPHIELTTDERARGDALRQGADLAIQPGARYELKKIPACVLREAAQTWEAEGRRLVLVGGPEERAEADALAASLRTPPVDLVGTCDVRETMAVLAGVRNAVGADTGVMHLAVAVGCPTAQIFGPTPTGKWGHAYPPHRVVAAPGGDMGCLTAATLRSAVGT